MIDIVGAVLEIFKAAKKEKVNVDSKYMVIKPRVLSDHNLLRGVSALKAAIAFIPPAAAASPALGLGVMGFKIWKRISLGRDYDQLAFPPTDPNVLRLSIESDQELSRHYGDMVREDNWNTENLKVIEPVYNDFRFLTDAEMLKTKYPHIDGKYVEKCATRNMEALQTNLDRIEQSLIQQSNDPEIEHNIREAFEYVKQLFPAMNDWALFKSDGFDELLELVDTVF